MSMDAMHWALEQQTGSATAKAVLMVLAAHANRAGTCYPGQSLLARETELGARTVSRGLDHLETLRLVERKRRYRPNGSRAADGYVLALHLPATVTGSQAATVTGRNGLPAAVTASKSGQAATVTTPLPASLTGTTESNQLPRNGTAAPLAAKRDLPATVTPPTSFERTDDDEDDDEESARAGAQVVGGLASDAAEALEGYGDLFIGCRGALRDYLGRRVKPERHYGWVQTLAMWLTYARPVMRWPNGSAVPPVDRTRWLAAALNDLAASDEKRGHSRPVGDPANLQRKLRVLLEDDWNARNGIGTDSGSNGSGSRVGGNRREVAPKARGGAARKGKYEKFVERSGRTE